MISIQFEDIYIFFMPFDGSYPLVPFFISL